MADKRATVSEAVTTCLAFCKDSPNPWAIAQLFIDRLRENCEWRPEEVLEVEQQIKRRLRNSGSERAIEDGL